MDFGFSPRASELQDRMRSFMEEHVFPAEAVYDRQLAEAEDPHAVPPVMAELKEKARAEGLWNLFLAHGDWGAGLTNLEYAPLAELAGRSIIGPEVFNCSAPDTGNMELLALYGTPEQQDRWLRPLLEARDPLLLRDDRAGRRQLRRPQHPHPHHARRRRLRRQRPQVVHLRDPRPGLRADHPDGRDRPGRARLPPAEHAADPARHPRRHRPAGSADVRLHRPARPRRGAVRGRPRAGREHARRGRRGLRARPGTARPGAHALRDARRRLRRAGACG